MVLLVCDPRHSSGRLDQSRSGPNPFNATPEAPLRILDNGNNTWGYSNDPQLCPQTGIDALTNKKPCAGGPISGFRIVALAK
ncbi:MAG TPA: hypothetical protein VH062_17845 [Polyangiaceae bacterium]|jgi:hypothetical protein|nr:hypothetical protein [Polyangiaceae bacterium]